MSSQWAAVCVGLVALSVSFFGTLGGFIAYFYKQIQTVGDMAAKDNDALAAVQDKARHDIRNEITSAILRHDTEILRLREHAATRAELTAMESRFAAMISEVKATLSAMHEKVSMIGVIAEQSKANGDMLRAMMSRNERKDAL